jgi:hypothetical protein
MAEGNAITVKIGAETDGIEQGIRNIQQSISKLGSKADEASKGFDMSFGKMAGSVALGQAAFELFKNTTLSAFNSVTDGIKGAIDLGGRLTDLSSRTGETAGKLLVLETAFKNSGLEAAQVGTVINKLQNFMADAATGGTKQSAAMYRLGLSLEDIKNKTPTQQLEIFAKRISAIQDPTERVAVASEIFGDKLGGKLLPLLREFPGVLDDAKTKVGSLAQVMDENASTFDAAGETIDAIKSKLLAFSAGLLAPVIPAVNDLGKAMESVDAASFGESVGQALASITKEYTEYAKATSAAAAGDYETANASKEVTGGLDLLKVMVNSVAGPISDLISGQDTYTAAANKAAEAAKNSAKGMDEVRDKAAAAAPQLEQSAKKAGEAEDGLKNLEQTAKSTGDAMAESFSLGADFKPQIEGIAGGWSDVGDKIAGTKPLLEGNFSIADSIAGKTDEQAQSIGGVNEQLDTTKKLNELIEGKVTETDKKLAEQKEKQKKANEEKQASLQLDLQIAEALAGGNEEQAKALQYQKDFNGYLKQAIDAGMGEPEANKFASAMAKAAGSAKDIKQELTESAKLFKSIEVARAKDAVDKGGRDTKRAQDAINRGDFRAAERAAGRIARREESIARRAAEKETAAAEAAKPLAQRMAEGKAAFRERFAKKDPAEKPATDAPKSLKDRLAENTKSFRDRMAGKDAVDKPGQSGQTDTAAKGSDKSGGKSSLDTLVGDIKKLLEKIEPKLPVAALV